MRIIKLGQRHIDEEWIIFLKKKNTLNDFLKKVNVKKGSFSENILARLFLELTSELHDLKKEYEVYYRKEYLSFADFLYKKLIFEWPLIVEIVKALKNGELVLYRRENGTGDYNLEQFLLNNETVLNKIGKLVEE